MSISLYVYSPDPPLDHGFLVHACRDPRLSEDLHWDLVFDGQTVFGWRPGSPHADRARAAVAAHDRKALEDLTTQEVLASLGLVVTTRTDRAWPVDAESIEATPAELRAAVANAQTHYSLETGARRNDLSLVFQEQLWRVIGVLSNGLMEDPQAGEYTTKDGTVIQPESTGPVDSEWERELGRIDAIGNGSRLFTVAVIVLLVAEAVSIPFAVQRLGDRQLWTSLVQLGLLGLFWYLARTGEIWGYWGLLAIAFGSAAIWTWALITPPPSPPLWTALQTSRTLLHLVAGVVLLLPAVRAYVASVREP